MQFCFYSLHIDFTVHSFTLGGIQNGPGCFVGTVLCVVEELTISHHILSMYVSE